MSNEKPQTKEGMEKMNINAREMMSKSISFLYSGNANPQLGVNPVFQAHRTGVQALGVEGKYLIRLDGNLAGIGQCSILIGSGLLNWLQRNAKKEFEQQKRRPKKEKPTNLMKERPTVEGANADGGDKGV